MDNQLAKANVNGLSEEAKEGVSWGWREDVFDGISGVLSGDAVNALRSSADVEYIVEGV